MRPLNNIGAILLIGALVAILIPPAAADEVETILKKHEKAVGGHEAISAVKAVASYATVEFMGLKGKSAARIEFPYKYRVDMDIGAMSQQRGYDGVTAWSVDPNGIVRADIAEEIKPMINELYFAGYAYLLSGRIPGTVEYRGDTLIEDVACYYLAMFPEGGDSMRVFIDTATGLVTYRTDYTTGIKSTSFFADYRTVEGVQVPFFTERITSGAPYTITAWVDSVQINPDLPDSIFAMPGKSAHNFSFPPMQNDVIAPLTMEGDAAYVDVYVNGQGPFLFLLDSGAGRTVISAALAEDLGVTGKGTVPARGIGGHGEMKFGRVDSIRIGQLSWFLSRITIFDFSDMAGSLSAIQGILGYDFFARFPMRIDFDTERMTIYHPEQAQPRLSKGIPFEIYCDLPVMEVMLDGYPIRVALDLGAQMSMHVQTHSRWYEKWGEKYTNNAASVTIAGVGGTDDALITRVSMLSIGPVGIENIEVVMADRAEAFPFPDYIEGLVGMGVVKRFNLYLDYPNRLIHLEKRGGDDK